MIVTLAQLGVFFLILARVGGVFLQAPVFSSRGIPATIKTGVAVWLALLLWFVIPLGKILPATPATFVVALINEIIVGFLIGFVCSILFSAVQAAGDIIDLQMGLSVAQVFDPIFGGATSIVGQLLLYLALVIFLTVDGHHLLLSALHQSFRALPLAGTLNFSGNLVNQLINLVIQLWLIGVQLAAPAVLMIFLSDFAFGIVSRVAPQVNVFMLGFQVKPSLGLVALFFSLPILIRHIISLIAPMTGDVVKLFAYLR